MFICRHILGLARYHGAYFDLWVIASHIGQELGNVGIHDVVSKMVLNPPHRLIAQVCTFFSDGHIFLIDLIIRYGLIRILKNGSMSDMYDDSPLLYSQDFHSRKVDIYQ